MENNKTNIMYNEVYDFLNIVGLKYINLIPNKMYEFIQNNKVLDYETNIDLRKNISSQISNEALAFIAYLNLMYWCKPEEKEKLIEKYKQNDINEEIKKKEKYNPETIFSKENLKIEEETKEVQLVEYKSPSFWKRLINFIKRK